MINARNHLVLETVCNLIKIRAFKKLLSSLGRIALLTHGNLDDYIQSGNIPMVRVSVGLAVRDSNVPLGSVFSPTCFSLFINEMKKYIL